MEITRLGLTPISAATFGCSAVARIARPSLVFCTIRSNKAITEKDVAIITISFPVIVAPEPKRSIGVEGNSCG
jgi:hypothetical protein